MDISKIKVGNTTYEVKDSSARSKLSSGEIVHYLTNVSGTAGTKSSNRTIWTGTADNVTALYTGLIVMIKIPLAGVNVGIELDVNNLGGHPVILNASTIATTHYPVNAILMLVYDSTQTASLTVNGTVTSYTGCWKVADYDANTTYSAGTVALLEDGTNTSNRVWPASVLANYVTSTVAAATKSITLKSDTTVSSQLTDQNTVYIIQDDLDLNDGTITIPQNSILQFEKGSVSNGTVVLQNTLLDGDVSFSNVTISGSCANEILTPQMFGAIGEASEHSDATSIARDTLGFENLARVVDNAGTLSKHIYIPSGHYSINHQITILSSCKIHGDGESSVIDCYEGSGGFALGYNGNKYSNSCTQLNTTITSDASKGDTELTLSSVTGLNVGDYLIITDTLDYSFNKSRAYYRTSELVKIVGISGNTVSLYNKLYGNYYAAFGEDYVTTIDPTPQNRTVISKFVPKQYIISDVKIYSHEHDNQNPSTYYTFIACGFAHSEFQNVIVENYGNKVAGMIGLGSEYKVSQCTFKNYASYIGDSYGLVVTNSQEFTICNSTFYGISHGLATGGGGSIYDVNNRNFVYRELYFDTDVVGRILLDVHGNSELYKYVDIYAPYITCDSGGYNITISGCRFYRVTSTFNLNGVRIIDSVIENASGELLLSNKSTTAGYGDSIFSVENSTIYGDFVVNMQDSSVDGEYSNADSVRPYGNFIFKNNVCENVQLRHGYMKNIVIESNTFNNGGFKTSDLSTDTVSFKNNIISDGVAQIGSQKPANIGFMYNTITTSTLPTLANTNNLLLSNLSGFVSNNIFRRECNDSAQVILVQKNSEVQIIDNDIYIENRTIALVYSISGSKVIYARNVSNTNTDNPVKIQSDNSGPLAYAAQSSHGTINASTNNTMAIQKAIGTPVYISRTNKLGVTSIATNGLPLISDRARSDTPYLAANTLVKDRVYAIKSNNSGTDTLYFSKTNDTTSESFQSDLLYCRTFVHTHLTTFTAPDPTEYPYIYITTSRESNPFYIYENRMLSEYDGAAVNVARTGATADRPTATDIYVGFLYYDTDLKKTLQCSQANVINGNVTWKEADGCTAGTNRVGTTSLRPTGTNIYVGFHYFDTTLNKMICATAISGSTVTWSDATTVPASLSAVASGTDLSLVTTGEKATWNAKGTVTGVTVGTGGTNYTPTNGVVTIPAYPAAATIKYTSIDANVTDINASVAANALLKTSQSLTSGEKAQVLTNLGITSSQLRNVTISTSEPTSGDGNDGDIWLVYEA